MAPGIQLKNFSLVTPLQISFRSIRVADASSSVNQTYEQRITDTGELHQVQAERKSLSNIANLLGLIPKYFSTFYNPKFDFTDDQTSFSGAYEKAYLQNILDLINNGSTDKIIQELINQLIIDKNLINVVKDYMFTSSDLTNKQKIVAILKKIITSLGQGTIKTAITDQLDKKFLKALLQAVTTIEVTRPDPTDSSKTISYDLNSYVLRFDAIKSAYGNYGNAILDKVRRTLNLSAANFVPIYADELKRKHGSNMYFHHLLRGLPDEITYNKEGYMLYVLPFAGLVVYTKLSGDINTPMHIAKITEENKTTDPLLKEILKKVKEKLTNPLMITKTDFLAQYKAKNLGEDGEAIWRKLTTANIVNEERFIDADKLQGDLSKLFPSMQQTKIDAIKNILQNAKMFPAGFSAQNWEVKDLLFLLAYQALLKDTRNTLARMKKIPIGQAEIKKSAGNIQIANKVKAKIQPIKEMYAKIGNLLQLVDGDNDVDALSAATLKLRISKILAGFITNATTTTGLIKLLVQLKKLIDTPIPRSISGKDNDADTDVQPKVQKSEKTSSSLPPLTFAQKHITGGFLVNTRLDLISLDPGYNQANTINRYNPTKMGIYGAGYFGLKDIPLKTEYVRFGIQGRAEGFFEGLNTTLANFSPQLEYLRLDFGSKNIYGGLEGGVGYRHSEILFPTIQDPLARLWEYHGKAYLHLNFRDKGSVRLFGLYRGAQGGVKNDFALDQFSFYRRDMAGVGFSLSLWNEILQINWVSLVGKEELAWNVPNISGTNIINNMSGPRHEHKGSVVIQPTPWLRAEGTINIVRAGLPFGKIDPQSSFPTPQLLVWGGGRVDFIFPTNPIVSFGFGFDYLRPNIYDPENDIYDGRLNYSLTWGQKYPKHTLYGSFSLAEENRGANKGLHLNASLGYKFSWN